ncbi:Berberine and berberine like family protein [Aspergillus niger]|uniref:Berberine and berberine like family protein n=1 Tax=Aspergillus niger TaxID=5061 RepID=A0A505IGS6_ASPNG|nr:Berberine and berberine like family protein [Aspergillus niger]
MFIKGALESFAENIVDNFLLPLRASSSKTPQVTPAALSLSQTPTPLGTRQRVSVLRKDCLVRDHHRCVISRKFDIVEARKRNAEDGDNCKDDNGNLLSSSSRGEFQYLEVAHILPYSLTTLAQGESELSEAKRKVFRILDMFDPGLSHRLDGPNIDRPINALTLTLDYHRLFSGFQIYFEPTGRPHEYKIDSLEESTFLRDPFFPVTRTLSLSPNQSIDSPDPRLLRVHCAIAHIMKLSGAGDYIEKVLRDMQETPPSTLKKIHLYTPYQHYHLHPSILHTCKQIHAEAFPILYTHNIFSITHPAQLLHHITNIGPLNTSLLRSLHIFVPWECSSSDIWSWVVLLNDLSEHATGLRQLEIGWDTHIRWLPHMEPGDETRGLGDNILFVHALARLRQLERMKIYGFFGIEWPDYLRKELGKGGTVVEVESGFRPDVLEGYEEAGEGVNERVRVGRILDEARELEEENMENFRLFQRGTVGVVP